MSEPFKRDYGYLHINTSEDKAKYSPKQKGDEYWYGGRWVIAEIDSHFGDSVSYRRPISPGPNFELVPLDGVIEKHDEWTEDGVTWKMITPPEAPGKKVRWQVENGSPLLAIRRPLPKPVEQGGWVSVKERLPHYNMHRVLCGKQVTDLAISDFEVRTPNFFHTEHKREGWTHWMEIPLEAPQPPRPAAEVAFEKWYLANPDLSKQANRSYFEDTWEAAIAWAKSNKGEL